MGRAFEPGSGEPAVANDAGWPAGAWDDLVHEQPPKGGLSPVMFRSFQAENFLNHFVSRDRAATVTEPLRRLGARAALPLRRPLRSE